MKYSLDSNVLITAWREGFPPDIVPGFWEKLSELLNTSDDLMASEEILKELEKKDDDVLKWAKNYKRIFIKTESIIISEVTNILRDHKKIIDTRKNRSGADPFAIALAKINNCKVLTEEKPTGKQTRPNIPDVCNEMKIECINLLDFIREQHWVFR